MTKKHIIGNIFKKIMEKIRFPQGKSVNTSYDKEADVL
jgi:hypothetical protein